MEGCEPTERKPSIVPDVVAAGGWPHERGTTMAATGQGSSHAAGSTATASEASLAEYLDLMRAFLRGELTAIEFERRYIALFGEDEAIRPEPTFRVLNDLFFAVDAFCADSALRDADDLDEDQLRARVRAALATLAP